jgi:protein-L-isoaspartate(D-aspartate) O-methyltransferase
MIYRTNREPISRSSRRFPVDQEKAFERQRIQMVMQLQGWNIRDRHILKAMAEVPRHQFVPTRDRNWAYEDRPLPMGYDQTMTQPHVVAYMLEQLAIQPEHRVLEIGTGLGYQTAILGQLAKEVYSLEIIPRLGEKAHQNLGQLGYRNVHVKSSNGLLGAPSHGPYDRIIICGSAPEIPTALLEQLAIEGKLIMPVGTERQRLQVITKTVLGQTLKTGIGVSFEPLLQTCPPLAQRHQRLGLRR